MSEINDLDHWTPSTRALSTTASRQVRFGATTAKTPVASNVRFPPTNPLPKSDVAPDEDDRKIAPAGENASPKGPPTSRAALPLWFGCFKSSDPYARVIGNSVHERTLFLQNGYDQFRQFPSLKVATAWERQTCPPAPSKRVWYGIESTTLGGPRLLIQGTNLDRSAVSAMVSTGRYRFKGDWFESEAAGQNWVASTVAKLSTVPPSSGISRGAPSGPTSIPAPAVTHGSLPSAPQSMANLHTTTSHTSAPLRPPGVPSATSPSAQWYGLYNPTGARVIHVGADAWQLVAQGLLTMYGSFPDYATAVQWLSKDPLAMGAPAGGSLNPSSTTLPPSALPKPIPEHWVADDTAGEGFVEVYGEKLEIESVALRKALSPALGAKQQRQFLEMAVDVGELPGHVSGWIVIE